MINYFKFFFCKFYRKEQDCKSNTITSYDKYFFVKKYMFTILFYSFLLSFNLQTTHAQKKSVINLQEIEINQAKIPYYLIKTNNRSKSLHVKAKNTLGGKNKNTVYTSRAVFPNMMMAAPFIDLNTITSGVDNDVTIAPTPTGIIAVAFNPSVTSDAGILSATISFNNILDTPNEELLAISTGGGHDLYYFNPPHETLTYPTTGTTILLTQQTNTTFIITNNAGGAIPNSDFEEFLQLLFYGDLASSHTEGIRTMSVEITDTNFVTATATTTIRAYDDIVAIDESNVISASNIGTISGNVLSNEATPRNGTISITEVDVYPAAVGNTYTTLFGEVTINSDGTYIYDVNENNSAVTGLRNGESLHDIISYTVERSVPDNNSDYGILTITINGVDENPVALDNNDSLTAFVNTDTTGNVITDPDPVSGESDSVDRGLSQLIWENEFSTALVTTSGVEYSGPVNGQSRVIDGITLTFTSTDPSNAGAANFNQTVNRNGSNGGHTGYFGYFLNPDPDPMVTTLPIQDNQLIIDFSQPVYNVGFLVVDIDYSQGIQWQDQIKIEGFLNTTESNYNYIIPGGVVDAGTNTFYGTGTAIPSDATGNVNVNFTEPINRLVLSYNYGPNVTKVPPDGQIAGVSDIFWQEDASTITVSLLDGNPVTVGASFIGTYGTLIINPDGSYQYTPDLTNPLVANLLTGQSLVDTFNYTLTDGVNSDVADLIITINGSGIDSDGDLIANRVDIDDDNDGVLDTVESGGTNPDGDVDGDGIRTFLDDDDNNSTIGNANGIVEPLFDLDGDNIANHLDSDSDGDGCDDVIESGGTDASPEDGVLDGNGFNSSGQVTTGSMTTDGYDGATGDELVAVRIAIATPVSNQTADHGDSVSFSVTATGDLATSYSGGIPTYGTTGNANTGVNYEWYEGDPDSGGTVLAGETNSSLSFTANLADNGKQYCVLITHDNNSCIRIKQCATLTVNPVCPNGGTITGGASICTGVNSTLLTLSGHTGTILRWESSTDNFATITTNEANAGSTTFTASNLTTTTYYRAVIEGVGCQEFSAVTTITVNADPSITVQPTATQTVCEGGTANISVTATGGVSLSYQWQSSTTSGGSFSNIAGATSASYAAPTTSAGTTYYRVVITDSTSGCNSVTSDEAEVIVNVDPSITVQPTATQTVCEGGTANISVTATGGVSLSYQWQSSTTSGGSFSNIAGATSASYAAPTTSAGTTYYRVVITDSASGCNSVTSNEGEVIVNADPSITVQPTATQTVCEGGTANISVTATGGVSLSYQWQSSTTSGGSFSNIAGANNASYSAPTTSAGTTYYRVVITDSVSGCNSVTSNEAEVIVNVDPSITVQPTATQTVCEGGTANISVTATGGVSLSYQWQSSTTSGGSFNNIAGANSASYAAPTTSAGTTYYRVVITDSASGCNSVTSNEAEVIVNVDPSITVQPTATQTVCEGGTASVSVTATGGVSLSYQWQSSTSSGGSFSNIAGANSASYSAPTTSAGTTYYRVVITDSASGCNSVTSNEAEVIVNVDPSITVQPTATQTVCEGGTANISVTATGGVSLSYQWQSSTTSGGSFNNIAGANSASYAAPTTSAGTTYYRVVITDSASGCNSVTSDEAEVIVNVDPSITVQPTATQTVCEGGTANISVTATGGVSLSYQWQSSTTSGGSFSNIAGATSASYAAPTTSAGTTYYRVVITDSASGCNSVTSNEGEVIVNADPSITVQPTATQTVCEGGTANISVTGTGGVSLNYQWQSSTTSGGSFSNIAGANNASYAAPTTSAGTTYYRVVITDSASGCNSVISNEAEVIVNADPSITVQPTATQTVCEGGTANISVTATGGVSLSYQWQSSTTSGGSFSNIAGANSASYSAPTTSAGTTYYRVVITDSASGCNNVTSNEAEVIVNTDPSITVQPTATQTVCEDGTANISVTATGGVSLSYQWQSSTTSGGSFSNIAGANSASYSAPTTSAGTTYYRVVVTDSASGCNNVTSNEAEVIVNADPSITAQPTATQTVCEDGTANISVTATGGVSLSYQWQSSTTSGGSFSNIAGANSASYSAPTTSAGTTYYRVVITDSASGCNSVTSDEAEVIVNADPSITAQPTASQTVCEGGTANISVTAIGGVSLSYQWQSSTTSGGSFSNIAGATSTSYAAPTTSAGTTYYRVVITDSASGCNSVTSNEAEVIVNADPSITAQPTATQTVCEGGTASVSVTATGGVSLNYQWQSSTTLGGSFSNIAGANSASYSAPTSSAGTTYYRVVITDSSSGCNSVTSNEAEVIVNADPSITAQPTATQTVCEDGIANISVTATDGVSLSYQWQSSTTSGGSFSNIAGATSASYAAPTTSAGTTYYRVVITDSASGCNSVTSDEAEVIVNADPSITAQPTASQTVCEGGTANISVTAIGGVSLSYQWQSSTTSGGSFSNIAGANSASYAAPTTSAGTTYYRVVITDSASGCNSVTSDEAEVIVNADPSITAQPTATQTVCEGGTANISVTGTGGVSLNYQWQSSTTSGGSFSNIAGANNASYAAPTTSAGTTYYRVVITDSASGCNSVISNEAEVIVNADPSITVQPTATQTVCEGGTANISVTATGGVSLSYQWQSSTTSGGSFSNIAGANSASYSAPTTSAGTTYYRVVITDSASGCNSVISNEAEVIVNTDPSITVQPTATQTVCEDGTANISVTATGGVSLSYQWQSSTTSGGSFSNIAGANSASYSAPTTSAGTTYYRVVITDSASGCNNVTSNEAEVIVNADPSITAQPTATQTVCEDGTANISVTATGGVSLSYQWQSSTTSGGSFSNIAGANSASYSAPTTSAGTTYYRVVITDSASGCNSVTSDEAEVIVNADPSITAQPTASQTVCEGGTANISVTAIGGVSLSYQWQSSTTSGGSFSNIAGATSTSYAAPTTSAGTTYYRVVITDSASGCNSVTSNEAEVIVNADPSITAQPTVTQTVCEGGTASVSVTATGGVSLNYQWQSSTTSGGSFSNIAGATSTSYAAPTTSAGTTYYRVVITDSASGCNSVTSNEAEVIVNADPGVTTQPTATQTVCEGGTASVSVTATGGVSLSYQWQSSTTSGGSFSNIAGANSASYSAPTSSAGTTYYRVVITDSTSGCNNVTSNEAEVIVNADPSITVQPTATQTVCEGGTANISVTATGGVSLSYQWQSSTTSGGSFSNIAGANSASYSAPTTSVGTTYYRVVITDSASGCNSVTSNEAEVIVNADPSITVQPTASQTVCEGGTASVSVTAIGGVSLSYQWQSSTTSGGSFSNIAGATSASYSAPTTSAGTTYYRVVTTDSASGCNSVTSNEAEVIVNADPSITAQPTATQTVCEGGTANISVTATGGVSLSYQWQSSTTSGGSFSNIAGATSASYAAPTTSAGTTYYRVVITDSTSGCNSVTSNETEVIVNADPSITVQPTATQTVCEGGTANISVTATGGVSLSYQWQSSTTSGGSFSNIAGANSASYSAPTTSVGTTYYRVVITDSASGCNSVTSNEAEVIVNADPSITVQPTASQTVCEGGTASVSVTAIGGVSLSYQWQSSTTSGGSFSNIAGATSASYSAPTTSAGTTYYRVVTTDSASGCNSVTSNEAEVIVNADPSITAQPTATQTVCEGGTANISVTATGGVSLSYQWQSSTTSGGSFSNIAGATSASYAAPTTSAGTTYYRVVITDSTSGCNSVTSNETEVIVNADPSITVQPIATQTVCEGGTASVSVTATGGVSLSYQWQSSTTSGGSFSNIAGANNASYAAPTTSAGTTYYRVVITDSASGCNSVTSDEAEVIVNADPSITAQPTASQTVCEDGTANISVTATGGVSLSYQWQSSTTSGGSFSNIAGANSASYAAPTTSAGTTYYRVVITDSASGCNSVTSNEAEVIVNADPSITAQPTASQTVCEDGTANISVTGTGGVSLSYQWQSSTTSGGSFSNIAGATSASYAAPTTSAGTTYYRVVITDSASGCNSVTSNEAEVIVNADPSITAQPTASQTVCEGGTASVSVTATGGVSLSYQWQSSTTSGGSFSNIAGANSASYSAPTSSAGTTYYRVVITDSASGCNNVTSNEAEVIVNADPSPPIIDTIVQPTCNVANGTINLNGLPTGNWILYQTGTSSTTYNGNTTTFSINTLSTGTYNFTVSDSNNCTTSSVLTVILGNIICGNDDDYSSTPITGGDSTSDVTANDTLDGVTVVIGTSPGEVTVNPNPTGITNPSELTLDPNTGEITVAVGTPSGTYTYTYELCENGASPANCDTATVTIVVANPIVASNDDYSSAPITGGDSTSDVTANDTLDGSAVVIGTNSGEVTVNPYPTGVTNPSELTLDPNTGEITVAVGTPSGTYTYTYELCENGASPANCDIATVTIVVANPIVASNDDYSSAPITGGDSTSDVTANDTLDGSPVVIGTNSGEVTVNPNPTGITNPSGLTLDPNTGEITVAVGTPSGTYTYTYEICENGVSPANCDIATVTIVVLDDTDGDGIPNIDDLDDDNDGILDVDEGDGSVDTDGDGIPDSLDSDSDNDGVLDVIEGNDDNGDGIPDVLPSGEDTDGDGIDDVYDLDNGGDPVDIPDSDGDGIPDYQDTDDDDDGIDTIDEGPGDGDPVTNDALDTNDNGIPDYLDTDTKPCGTPYNILSPNGDGDNDVFFISCINNPEYENNSVEIFNRWGNTVYKASGYNNEDVAFRGISNGRANINVDDKLPSGTYYYVIDLGDGSKPKVGWLYINR